MHQIDEVDVDVEDVGVDVEVVRLMLMLMLMRHEEWLGYFTDVMVMVSRRGGAKGAKGSICVGPRISKKWQGLILSNLI